MSDSINLLDHDRKSLETFFTRMGEKTFRATQILQWIHQKGVTDFDAMSNISLSLRKTLSDNTTITFPEIIREQKSSDGTRKWLIKLDDIGNSIETVFIPEENRGTLCVSSQVGCPLDCQFCSTAKQGFNRNLSTAEIIAQVWLANERLGSFENDQRRITNVVMMGMGEPLLNFDKVLPALEIMKDDLGYNLARKRVTVSTAGLVPAIDRLANETNVALAVSLHASNDETRSKIVPLNKKYPIKELLAACKRYAKIQGGDSITFEYVMLDGVNDSLADARQLAKILADIPAKVNLIPFNPFPGAAYECSGEERINDFREVLMAQGIITITRKTRGDDIDAACGQLVGKVNARAKRQQKLENEARL